MKIVEVNNLKKSYLLPGNAKERFNAVDGISFKIMQKEIYGILGPNGAGKTTTLEMLEGLKEIDDGFAIIDGIDVSKDPYAVKKVIGVNFKAMSILINWTSVSFLPYFLNFIQQALIIRSYCIK